MWASCLLFTALCIAPKPVDLSKLDAAEEDAKRAIAAMDASIKKGKEEDVSLLQTGSRPSKPWSSQDSAQTEELLKESFQNIDKVQNDILKAADTELEKEKSLPTLAQATTKWDASEFSGPSGPAPQSLLQTKSPNLDQEYAKTVDFSELDKLRHQIDSADSRMVTDFQAIKAQGEKDAALAKELGKPASFTQSRDEGTPTPEPGSDYVGFQDQEPLAPRDSQTGADGGSTVEATWPSDAMNHGVPEAVDAGEMAAILERARGIPSGRVPAKAQSFGEAMSKLDHVRQNLARIEKGMAAKEQLTGASPEQQFLRKKLQSLLSLSSSARSLVTGASEETDPAGKLARFAHMKDALRGLKEELAEHFNHVSQVPHGSSLVEQAPVDAADGGYGQIEKNLASLHDRIESQVGALNRKAKQATAAEVHALDVMGPKASEQYQFAWANDMPGDDVNMRTAPAN